MRLGRSMVPTVSVFLTVAVFPLVCFFGFTRKLTSFTAVSPSPPGRAAPSAAHFSLLYYCFPVGCKELFVNFLYPSCILWT